MPEQHKGPPATLELHAHTQGPPSRRSNGSRHRREISTVGTVALPAFVCCNTFRDVLAAYRKLIANPPTTIRAVHSGCVAAVLALCTDRDVVVAANAVCRYKGATSVRDLLQVALPPDSHERVEGILALIMWDHRTNVMHAARRWKTTSHLIHDVVEATRQPEYTLWGAKHLVSSAWGQRGKGVVVARHVNVHWPAGTTPVAPVVGVADEVVIRELRPLLV